MSQQKLKKNSIFWLYVVPLFNGCRLFLYYCPKAWSCLLYWFFLFPLRTCHFWLFYIIFEKGSLENLYGQQQEENKEAPWTKYLSKWVIPLTLAATVALAVSRCRQKYCQEGRRFSMMSWGRLYQVLGAIQIHRFTRNSLPKTHKMDKGGGEAEGDMWSRVEWFWENNFATCHVVPNCFTVRPKFQNFTFKCCFFTWRRASKKFD